jgi:putative transposase
MKREIIPESPHNVVLRGNNRRRLFSYPREYQWFLWQVGRALLAFDCRLYSIALLANHVHMILWAASHPALAGFVKQFAQRYAQARNHVREASGKLFEQRYYAKPIRSDEQFALTTAYVDANAVRHGLARAPGDYVWSSYGLHVGDPCVVGQHLWTPSEWYLSLGDTQAERQAEYRRWVDYCIATGKKPDHHEEIDRLEAISLPYGRRLLRPDETSAAEPVAPYRVFTFPDRSGVILPTS